MFSSLLFTVVTMIVAHELKIKAPNAKNNTFTNLQFISCQTTNNNRKNLFHFLFCTNAERRIFLRVQCFILTCLVEYGFVPNDQNRFRCAWRNAFKPYCWPQTTIFVRFSSSSLHIHSLKMSQVNLCVCRFRQCFYAIIWILLIVVWCVKVPRSEKETKQIRKMKCQMPNYTMICFRSSWDGKKRTKCEWLKLDLSLWVIDF